MSAEIALSGSEQNSDLTGRNLRRLAGRVRPGPTPEVRAFQEVGVDFVSAGSVPELAAQMNQLVGEHLIDDGALRQVIEARDLQVRSGLGKDPQVVATVAARRFLGDRLLRVVSPHELLDPKAPGAGRAGSGGPLVAIRLHVLTRKTLGGLETDLEGRVMRADGSVLPGVYAVGEAAGFGGGGVHGYRALEGTFLGGCLFSGRTAGRRWLPACDSASLAHPVSGVATIQRGLVVAYHFGNHEVQELFGELGIEPGIFGERSEPRDLFGLPYRVGRRQAMRCLQLTDLLSDLEALGEEMHKGRIHVVDAHPKPQQLIGHRVTHGAQPNQLDLSRAGRKWGRTQRPSC